MASFFDNLGLSEQVVSDESANIDGGGFPLINGGTNSISVIHKFEWKDAFNTNDPRYIQVTFKLTDTSFKDCFAYCKIHINDKDEKKRQKGANLFSRFYALCNIQPPAHLPTDQDLAFFQGQALGIEVSYWLMQDKHTKVWSDGNWVGSIFPTTGFVSFDGKEVPADITALNATAVPQQSAPRAPTQQIAPQQQAQQQVQQQMPQQQVQQQIPQQQVQQQMQQQQVQQQQVQQQQVQQQQVQQQQSVNEGW